MPRSYSDEFVRELYQRKSDDLGTQLARPCVAAGLPMRHVSRALGVTHLTVFTWFRSKSDFYAVNEARIRLFLRILSRDLEDPHLLPVTTLRASEKYIAAAIEKMELLKPYQDA
jgi:AcrR family transcriptional regulator